jgi:hypothetical protein
LVGLGVINLCTRGIWMYVMSGEGRVQCGAMVQA